jgi:hypothetical protein
MLDSTHTRLNWIRPNRVIATILLGLVFITAMQATAIAQAAYDLVHESEDPLNTLINTKSLFVRFRVFRGSI